MRSEICGREEEIQAVVEWRGGEQEWCGYSIMLQEELLENAIKVIRINDRLTDTEDYKKS